MCGGSGTMKVSSRIQELQDQIPVFMIIQADNRHSCLFNRTTCGRSGQEDRQKSQAAYQLDSNRCCLAVMNECE